MKRFLTVLVLLYTALSVASCNTLRGAGRDIEKVGDAVEDAAN